MTSLDVSQSFNQTFTVHDRDGYEHNFTLENVATYTQSGITQCIVYGSQIGAAAAILVILLLLTKHEKRRSPVFILNSTALLCIVISAIFACLYYTSSWYSPYAIFTGDFSFVSTSAKAVSITKGIFDFFSQLAIEISLVLQVHVVCVTLDKTKRLILLLISMFVAVTAMGFRLAQIANYIHINVILESYNDRGAWLKKARDIALTVSICYFSAVFCAKLGWSLLQRRQLGLTQFGPMQIIFIGGTQTLIIPGMKTHPFSRARC